MSIIDVFPSDNPRSDLAKLQNLLHEVGPETSQILESLSYYKSFHASEFSEIEEQIVSALGLFYKVKNPSNLYSFLLAGIGNQHLKDYGEQLTPVQASVRRAIDDNEIVSISAPTSAGKSFSIRDFIADQEGDAVVIVPSRALIAEYVNVMKRRFLGDKNVMVSSFVDVVFTSRDLRRIFVLTPERARDLFANNLGLNIQIFFFDEAQISDEGVRGVIFDVLIRRIKKRFPASKLVFAHPFVENPEAQLMKHDISADISYSRSYTYGAVGKICVFQHDNGKSYYFSPYEERGHILSKCIEFPGSFDDFAFNGENSVLVYISKSSIYNGSFLDDYGGYLENLPVVIDQSALQIIEHISGLIGADENTHKSEMVTLMKKGVVIHHGSVPLEIRFLIEDFIRGGYAKVCFATSTLAQGVNMPFDIVWLHNMRFHGDDARKALAFKNLIGRSGRLTNENKFDYGYVFTKNPKLFIERNSASFKLNEQSVIDAPIDDELIDSSELIDAMKNDSFDEDKHLPNVQVERLSDDALVEFVRLVLEIFFEEGKPISQNLAGSENRGNRDTVKACLQDIYQSSLGRALLAGEKEVFSQAITVFFWVVQGKSFREIVGLRYSGISRRDEKSVGSARFSQPAQALPNSKLSSAFSIFKKDMPAKNVSFDTIVFDTYDYLDQVLSYSLSDVFIAAFDIYKEKTGDLRAGKMVQLLRFGTNDANFILLMRYGFPPESVPEIATYLHSIDEREIVFKPTIEDAAQLIKNLVEWYLP